MPRSPPRLFPTRWTSMHKRVLITLYGEYVAPRFDLATEVLIATLGPGGKVEEEKTMVLPESSAEKLCHMIITEDIQAVVCGGIEEEYYDYLRWKRIDVMDSVIGRAARALELYGRGELRPGAIFWERSRVDAFPGSL